MSTAERKELYRLSKEADKEIRFASYSALESQLKKYETMLVFFGANWCSNTARFNPQYLETQKDLDSNFFETKHPLFKMIKIECTTDKEYTCTKVYNVEGYPTVFLFRNGAMLEEYTGGEDFKSLSEYIRNLTIRFPSTEKVQIELWDNSPGISQEANQSAQGADRDKAQGLVLVFGGVVFVIFGLLAFSRYLSKGKENSKYDKVKTLED